MTTSCVLKSEDRRFPDIILTDGQSCHVGRNKNTRIKDLKCSKRQVEATANFEQGTVRVIQTGSNYSEVQGERLRTDESRILKNGDSINLIKNKLKYTVVFRRDATSAESRKRKREESCEDDRLKTGSKDNISDDDEEDVKRARENLKEMKSSLSSYFKPLVSKTVAKTTINHTISSTKWTEAVPGKLFHFQTSGCNGGSKIASFDIDGTLITTKSGKVFPTSLSDWKILIPQIPSKLQALTSDGYQIVLYTNQKGIARGVLKPNDFCQKLQDIAKQLAVPFQALVSSGSGIYRKPMTGMWDYYIDNFNNGIAPDKDNSFYVGDAAGRPANWEPKRKKDFSCSDRLFALNCQLKFFTPEEYFLKQKPAPFSMPEFNPKELNGPLAVRMEPSEKEYSESELCKKPELVVFVGYPGSGKSYFAQKHLVSKGYVHVNRDTLGNYQKCQALCDSALSKGGSVVIDNTNPDKESRKRYIDIAKKHKVNCRCFHFQCSIKHAEHNIVFRELTSTDHAKVNIMILNSFKSKFEQPVLTEGFSEIVFINFVPRFKSEKDKNLYNMYLT